MRPSGSAAGPTRSRSTRPPAPRCAAAWTITTATTAAGTPHLLVNQKSKTTAGPVSVSYLEKLLSPAAVTPTLLRVTRLAHLVTTLDPVIVAAAFGVRRGTVLHYLADTVDASRLANP